MHTSIHQKKQAAHFHGPSVDRLMSSHIQRKQTNDNTHFVYYKSKLLCFLAWPCFDCFFPRFPHAPKSMYYLLPTT